MSNETIREIAKQWLTQNGYEGLAGDDCGCEVDDLMPCDEPHIYNCVPGHKVEGCCEDECSCRFVEATNPYHWHMVAGKKGEIK